MLGVEVLENLILKGEGWCVCVEEEGEICGVDPCII